MSVLILRGNVVELSMHTDYTTHHIEEYVYGYGLGNHGLEIITGAGGANSWSGCGCGAFTVLDHLELHDDWLYANTY